MWQRKMERARSKLLDDSAMLFIETLLQRSFTVRVQGKQVEVIVRSPVQYASTEIDGGIDERVRSAAIFRLDVIRRVACFHVRIVTEEHSCIHHGLRGDLARFVGSFRPHLTDWLLNRYYSNSPMSGSGLHTYAPLLLHLLIAAALAGAMTAVSVLVGWRRPSRAKQQPYECGMEPIGDAREPFSVKFYLVAMVFILFDVEAIFLYPWAYIFRSLRWYGFAEMMMYIAILLVGYLYLWKKGALDWHK